MPIAMRNAGEPSEPILAETERICFRRSPIHGVGGFSKQDVAAGTRLIEYVGAKITKHESLRRCELNNECIFSLNDAFDLDGKVEWNPARFLNHSCAPNCEAGLDGGRIWVTALRRIEAGEELTFNYGYDLEDYREHPCRCGAPDCVGYIVAEVFFDFIRSKRAFNHRLTVGPRR